jgi:apolipoprotein N-acyltransferase
MLDRFRARRAAPRAASVEGTRPSSTAMLLAALAGGASLFSFAPFGWWPVQFLLLAYFFYQLGRSTSVKRAAWIGWAFGFGWCVAGMHWLYISIHRFGGVSAPLAAIAICLLGLYMGLFGAFAASVSAWLRKRWSLPLPAFFLIVLPVLWGVSEWMRGWVFTGFPWASSGYAHNAAPLGGYAALVGVYGIGILVGVCAGCVTLLTQQNRRVPALGLLAIVLAAGWGLRTITWTQPSGQPISVRLLQGDIRQDEKFDTEFLMRILARYQKMITAAPADLIATPETAIPIWEQSLPPGYVDGLRQWSVNSGSALMLGIPLANSETDYANSVVGFSSTTPPYSYDKHHLVPFGEFVPTGFRWVTDLMQIPLGDNRRGAAVQAPFAVKDQLVLPNICYEDVFGEEIAAQLRTDRPATLLLNVSNLAWFGESVAIPQHLQISQMRSMETGRPMLRATNTGATAIIDGKGQVVAQLPFYGQGVLSARVQGMRGMTPFIRFGSFGFLVLGALALLGAWFSGLRYARVAKASSV